MTRFVVILLIVSKVQGLAAQAPGIISFGYLQGLDFSTEPPASIQTKMRENQAFDSMGARSSNCFWQCDGNMKYYNSNAYVFNGYTGDTIVNGHIKYWFHPTQDYNSMGYYYNFFLPKPNSQDTVFYFYAANDGSQKPLQLCYGIIDNRINNGSGGFVKKDIPIQARHWNIHYTRHSNNRWWWIVTALNEDTMASYLVTDTGVILQPEFL